MPAFPYTADYFSGLTVTTSALAALYKMQKTGIGESIDVAMYEVMLRMGQYFMMDYFNGGEVCPRMTKGKDPYYAGCGLYKCQDGYIVMELVGVNQIQEMFKDMGIANLLGTPEIPEGTQLIHRVECPFGELVEDKLDEYLAGKPYEEALARFAELNIASAKVLTIPELESNPQYIARESITTWIPSTAAPIKGRMSCRNLKIIRGKFGAACQPTVWIQRPFLQVLATLKPTLKHWWLKGWLKPTSHCNYLGRYVMDMIGKRNLRQAWDDLAELYGNKTALIVERLATEHQQREASQYSYTELNNEINRTANLFYSLGITKGNKVALHLNNCAEFIFCWFGLAKIGAIVVPINANLLRDESAYIINQCEATLVVTSAEFYSIYADLKQQGSSSLRQIMLIDNNAEALLASDVLYFQQMKKCSRYLALFG
jgi:hypothetical protein